MSAPRPAADGPRQARVPWRDLALLALLLVLVRGALVAALGDVFTYGEELEKGAAAKALLDGLGLDRRLLAYHEYEGGGFVISHLDALAFALVGQSLLALKLVALGVHLGLLAAAWRLAVAAGGRAAGVVLGLLLALAPGPWARISLLALGIHLEALVFVALVLWLGGRAVLAGDTRARTLLALGLCAGFGIYFSYQLVVAAGFALGALVLVRGRSLLGRGGIALAAGLALGLAPLAWMASRFGAKVLDVHGQSLVEGPRAPFATVGEFLHSLVEGRGPLALAALAFLALLPGVALVPCFFAREARSRWLVWLGAWAALQLGAYLASGFALGALGHWFPLGRLAPLFLAWLLASALGLGALWTRAGRARLLAGALVALVLALGARETLRTLAAGSPATPLANLARLARTKGYQYSGYLRRVAARLPGPTSATLAVLRRFDEPDPSLLEAELGAELFRDPTLSLERIRAELASCDEPVQLAIARGLGGWLFARAGDQERAVALARAAPPPWREALLEAAGRYASSPLVTLEGARRDLANALARGFPEPWLEGFGQRLENLRGQSRVREWRALSPTLWFLDPRAPERFVAEAPAQARAALARGLARARAERDLAPAPAAAREGGARDE